MFVDRRTIDDSNMGDAERQPLLRGGATPGYEGDAVSSTDPSTDQLQTIRKFWSSPPFPSEFRGDRVCSISAIESLCDVHIRLFTTHTADTHTHT